MKTSHIIKRLKEDTQYQEFFKKAMAKFDIETPADLKDPERKKAFFNYVDKNYKAKSEGKIREVVSSTDLEALKDYIVKKYPTDIELHGLFNQTLKAVQMNSQVARWKAIQPIAGGALREDNHSSIDFLAAKIQKAKNALDIKKPSFEQDMETIKQAHKAMMKNDYNGGLKILSPLLTALGI